MSEQKQIFVGWLIDGTGAPVQKKVLVTVEKGIIRSLTSHYTGSLSDSCTDLGFATIVPPFIDCHVHLAMSGGVAEEIRSSQLQAECADLKSVISRHLGYLFSHGVLAVRDGGDRGACVREFRKTYEGPVAVYTPGPAWYRDGRYGRLIGRAVTEKEELAQSFAEIDWDFDHVKLVNSGLNSLTDYGKTTRPQFDRGEIGKLVSLSGRDGKKVMVHANGVEPVREAIEGGCHSIEHGFFMGRDNLERMAAKGVVWVPTAVTMKMYAEVRKLQGDKDGAEIAHRNLMHQLEQISMAVELGVEVGLGSDSGSSGVLHGESLVDEMKLLIKGGLSLAGSIRSATLVGARLLGIENWGTIEVGKRADFLVARGGPGQLPRKFSYLEDIYTSGVPDNRYRKNPFKHTGETAVQPI
ncbi:amidohydrolase family protein [Desulfopila sp. IMCC35008]|uniref:amidohydrolase family protein n=1 Tax=Desulfopila sp. IMCC35008 TaxID=2653858 RepID=UPI0013D29AB6|nr:amidohydrolase family protein [Desulfopila sp. IMCC35008]